MQQDANSLYAQAQEILFDGGFPEVINNDKKNAVELLEHAAEMGNSDSIELLCHVYPLCEYIDAGHVWNQLNKFCGSAYLNPVAMLELGMIYVWEKESRPEDPNTNPYLERFPELLEKKDCPKGIQLIDKAIEIAEDPKNGSNPFNPDHYENAHGEYHYYAKTLIAKGSSSDEIVALLEKKVHCISEALRCAMDYGDLPPGYIERLRSLKQFGEKELEARKKVAAIDKKSIGFV